MKKANSNRIQLQNKKEEVNMKTNNETITVAELVTDMRKALGLAEHLSEPQEVQIGYLLSFTSGNPGERWLIENLLPQGSVNLLAIENPEVGNILVSMASQDVVAGNPFFEQPVQQGAVLTYTGGNSITTQGTVEHHPRKTTDDPTYLPFQVPLPPDCGFVKDFNRSGVKMNLWAIGEEGKPEDEWLRETAQLVRQFAYLTETENAAVICAAPYPKSMDLAIRSFMQAPMPEPTLSGYWLWLTFLPERGCSLALEPIEDLVERVHALAKASEPVGPAPDRTHVDRIYWLDDGAKTMTAFCDRDPVEHLEDGDYIAI